MITLKHFPNQQFATKEEAMRYLVANEKLIVASKKSAMKYSLAPTLLPTIEKADSEGANKTTSTQNPDTPSEQDTDTIKVRIALNACNYFDTHGDVSIEKSWNRTAKNTKNGLHLQEHKMQFANLISDKVSFTTERVKWSDLGIEPDSDTPTEDTEVLIMESVVEKDSHPYMFKMYKDGRVKNHSAGLRYVNIKLAINSSEGDMKSYKEVWDKYYPQIANKAEVDEEGYFWAILEQKIIEGSAVVRGSNPATPTISVENAKNASAPTTKEKDSQDRSTPRRINPNFY